MKPQDAGLPDPASDLPLPGRSGLHAVAGRIEPLPLGPNGPSASPPGLAAPPALTTLLQALRRRWIAAVLLGGILAVTAAGATWYLLTPKHVASGKIQVAASPLRIIEVGYAGQGDFKTLMATTAGQITSRPVI